MSTRVLFDLYGVFLTHKIEDSLARLTELVKADAAQHFRRTYLELRTELEAGKISDERWWHELSERSRTDSGEIPEVTRALDSTFQLNNEGLEMAMAVIDAGFVTGIFANVSPGFAQIVRERFTWLDEFAAVIFSCDIGVCKPQSEAFEVASESLGGAAKDTIYFDSNEEFVQAGRNAGLQAYSYPSPQDVLTMLDELKP